MLRSIDYLHEVNHYCQTELDETLRMSDLDLCQAEYRDIIEAIY